MTEKVELDNSIYICNQKFPDNMCDALIDLFEYRLSQEPSTVFTSGSQGMHSLDRKDRQTFLDEYADSNQSYDLTRDFGSVDLANTVNEYLNIAVAEYYELFESLKSVSIRSTRQKLQKTVKGGGYHIWHYEQMNLSTTDRILVWTIYLNDVEEGGETEFLYQSKRVKAKKGDICIFPAQFNYTHRGNPPLSGDKYIATGWYNIYE